MRDWRPSVSVWHPEHEPAGELHSEDEPQPPEAEDLAPSDAPEASDPLGWPKLPEGLLAQPLRDVAEQPLAATRGRFPRIAAPVAVALVLVAVLGGCLRACAGQHAAVVSGSHAYVPPRKAQRHKSQSAARTHTHMRRPWTAVAFGRRALAPAVPPDVEPGRAAWSSALPASGPGLMTNGRARLEFGFER